MSHRASGSSPARRRSAWGPPGQSNGVAGGAPAAAEKDAPRPSAAGGSDAMFAILKEIGREKSGEDDQTSLRDYVETEARDLAGEHFVRLTETLYVQIEAMCDSSDPETKRAGILAIDQLLECDILGDRAAKLSRFANALRSSMEQGSPARVIDLAAHTFGHLVACGGPATADVVEHTIQRSLAWLHGEQQELHRYAAVVLLREMADNAPAVFNVHVRHFIERIWSPLRDPKKVMREAAVNALRSCLCLVEKRETRYRVQWYYRLFEDTQRGLTHGTRVEIVHGSLLALGELLRHTGEFMLARYREVVSTVLRFRDARDKIIRQAVIRLLPRLAAFSPERFSGTYLRPCIDYLLTQIQSPSERAAAFEALGDIAVGVRSSHRGIAGLQAALAPLAALIHEAVAVQPAGRRGSTGPAPAAPGAVQQGSAAIEAIRCAGQIAHAVGPAWSLYVKQLIEPMLQGGLHPTLVESLATISRAIPELLGTCQAHLLDVISIMLSRQPFHTPPPDIPCAPHPLMAYIRPADGDPAAAVLALRALGTFNLEVYNLLTFLEDTVVGYLEASKPEVRREAAMACVHVMEQHALEMAMLTQGSGARGGGGVTVGGDGGGPADQSQDPCTHRLLRHRHAQVQNLVMQLLSVAVSDLDPSVRCAVLRGLSDARGLDTYMAQAQALGCFFLSLNDESATVRQLAISVVGRLAPLNPAYVLPALRKHLQQLLSDMDHAPDCKQREHAAGLLGCLLTSAPGLALPYLPSIAAALVSKLRLLTDMLVSGTAFKGGTTEIGVLEQVLSTVGELAWVARGQLRPHIGDLLPLVIACIRDGSGALRREVAVSTLGALVESCGYAMRPYLEYPGLLTMLLRLLQEGGQATRREVIRVLGIIGALDPYTSKITQGFESGEGKLEAEGVRAQRQMASGEIVDGEVPTPENDPDVLPVVGLATSSEEYYPTVAINSLMRLLRDPGLTSHNHTAVRSLIYIFQALGLACVPFLGRVMPLLLSVLRQGDTPLREYILQQLTSLVSVIRQHSRRYLPDLVQLVEEYWDPASPLIEHLLRLVGELARVLQDDLRPHVPRLLPRIISVLIEAERTGSYATVPPLLEALEAMGPAMEQHLHLVLPSLVRLINPWAKSVPAEVSRGTLGTLRRLLPRMQPSGHANAIIHPLLRVLRDPHHALRQEALSTITALMSSMGPESAVFLTAVQRAARTHNVRHAPFDALVRSLTSVPPPCMTDAESDAESVAYRAASDSDAQAKAPAATPAHRTSMRLVVNEASLRRAWVSSDRSTKEDWVEWLRNFSVELLKESSSPALRACHTLALIHPPMARDLFPAGFVSCWTELSEATQEQLVRSLEAALASPTIPPEIVTALLNLAEFMEHDEKALPLDNRTLGALAEKCHAFAKALHYRELEFETNPQGVVEPLISINNQLRQPEAAIGIMEYARRELGMQLLDSWYEKQQQWDQALAAYERHMKSLQPGFPGHLEATVGCLRCLAALAEWQRLADMCRAVWSTVEPYVRREIAPLAAYASWHMGSWEEMADYLGAMDPKATEDSSTGCFLRAVLCTKRADYGAALSHVERARALLGAEVSALAGETYERAYRDVVRIQQLTELEEVIEYFRLESCKGDEDVQAAAASRRATIRNMWHTRMEGVQRDVEVWQALLSVRSLVLSEEEDEDTWIKFSTLCRKSGRVRQAHHTLVKLLRYDPECILTPGTKGYGAGSGRPKVMYTFLKHMWATGKREEAFARLAELRLEVLGAVQTGAQIGPIATQHSTKHISSMLRSNRTIAPSQPAPLLARINLRLGLWRWSRASHNISIQVMQDVLTLMRQATEDAPEWGKAWHHHALYSVAAMNHYARNDPQLAQGFLRPAITGFFRSIAIGQGQPSQAAGTLQDILRLLTLWFNHGDVQEVQDCLHEGFAQVSITTWLAVIPQIIARIHATLLPVRTIIHQLLVRIGQHHPQALMYPLIVACKSSSAARRASATAVIENLRQHSAALVDQAQLVSKELIRVAILWHEMWHEALEEASRLYFGENNAEGMLATLLPLHDMMEPGGSAQTPAPTPSPAPSAAPSAVSAATVTAAPAAPAGDRNVGALPASARDLEHEGPTTPMEVSFVQHYGRELREAHDWCMKYRASRREADLHQAWDLYYHVFKRINKQLPTLTSLELQHVSPALLAARDLELAVPGTYAADHALVKISHLAPQLHVITSKQRPRKLTVHGADGALYMFLLKGHEDLRQDERVMQLFGLVNNLLASERMTAERGLSIGRYAVIPLSPNSGLIGWVPNCDTLHALIREYREARKIPLNVEHRLMLGMAPDYEHLTVIQKVEVFQHALDSTPGDDLHKVLWLKSRTSEVWLDRRTNYARSVAVMSMVGYLLGLGDRHPSNLMLDRFSGKLLHIDFGDCFEASMHREKFPEKVPFRLTRMMIRAMEVSGIEGNFRITCENTLRVLRSNKDSVMAMLEAFVHDPLINWRLLHTEAVANSTAATPAPTDVSAPELDKSRISSPEVAPSGVEQSATERPAGNSDVGSASTLRPMGGAADVLNERAVAVMERMSDKLTGKDFKVEGRGPGSSSSAGKSVPVQVQMLIDQATSDENLCLAYIGWCPFW
ncbi:unnamed protein product [Pedinophyceae sp. YPF-701]|nr:unnamed protein product [Pedinophyceae sp. YPF-701]